jgi:phage FluMu protein gp41
MFKENGHYYIATSDLHGWNSSATHVIRSVGNDIQGPYSAEYVMPGSEADYSHVSQPASSSRCTAPRPTR